MTTVHDLEIRLAELEARLGPVPQAVPPITIGSIPDSPAPGSPIASNWATEMTNRIVHRFATAASRDTAWPASSAGVGSVCITIDTGTIWIVNSAAAWVPRGPGGYIGSATIPANVILPAGVSDIAGLSVAFTAYAGRRYRITGSIYGFNQNGAGAIDIQVRRSPATAIQGQLVSRVAGDTPTGACIVGLDSPPAGAVTYVLTASVTATGATVYATAAAKGLLLVEEIGYV